MVPNLKNPETKRGRKVKSQAMKNVKGDIKGEGKL